MRTRYGVRAADTTIDYGMRAKWIAGCRGVTGQERQRQSMYKVPGPVNIHTRLNEDTEGKTNKETMEQMIWMMVEPKKHQKM